MYRNLVIDYFHINMKYMLISYLGYTRKGLISKWKEYLSEWSALHKSGIKSTIQQDFRGGNLAMKGGKSYYMYIVRFPCGKIYYIVIFRGGWVLYSNFSEGKDG